MSKTGMRVAASDWSHCLAPRVQRMRASEIRELLRVLDRPEIISLAGGIPDPHLLPREAVAEAANAILSDPRAGAQALQYGASEGYPPLRAWLAGHMRAQGVPCDAENILITSGAQQGLEFLGKLLLGPGRRLAVTAPTYLGALQAFNAYEPDYTTLDIAAPALDGVAAAYVVADFANPSGHSLTTVERERLVAEAAAAECPLIEDAAYRELRFQGITPPACLALDVARTGHIDRSRVIYCGTFSKTLSPGLRVGWICAARPLIEKLVLTRQAADLHGSFLNQMIVERLARERFDAQVAANRATYAARRDVMAEALATRLGSGFRYAVPEGGMFFWLEGPKGMDFTAMLPEAVERYKVAYVPGRAFFADGTGDNTLRLNFTMNSPERIAQGITRLAGCLAERYQGVAAG